MDEAILSAVERAARLLRGAESVLFVTGAGISADSGVPTYRGVGGIYNEGPTEDGIPIEQALSGAMMRRNPSVTWKYIHQIESACRGATFNRAHAVLAEAEQRFERVWVLTQNVDGLHLRAGSRNVIDIHGDVHHLRCTGCGYRRVVADYADLPPLPQCPECDAPLRPDVVLFGELLPSHKLDLLDRELENGFDAVFAIGTTSLFPYISRPMAEARQAGKLTVEINPDQTLLSSAVDFKLPLGAAEACDAIWTRLTAI